MDFRIRCILLHAALLLLLPVAAVHAQSAEEDLLASYGDEEFISIATGVKTRISKAPAVATVITSEDIQNMGAENLDQVLESVAGLHVSLSSYRFSPVYQIRGIATNTNPQVLVLVNGIPITQVFQSDRGVNSTLPVHAVERLEIIRGPGSAIYGADAFSGVINVITKSAASKETTTTGIRSGSFSTQSAWLQHHEKLGNYNFLFSFETYRTEGDDSRIIRADLQSFFDLFLPPPGVSHAPGPANTQQERHDIRMQLSQPEWTLNLWNWRQQNLGTGPGIASVLDPEGQTDVNNTLLDFSYKRDKGLGNWNLQFNTAYMDYGFDTYYVLFPAGSILPIGSDGNISPPGNPVMFTDGFIGAPAVYEKHFLFDAIGFYTGYPQHNIRLATGTRHSNLTPAERKNFGPGVIDGTEGTVTGQLTDVTGTPYIYMRNARRNVYYASLQDEWSYAPDWTLTTGLRFDHYSDVGSTFNPRLALVWNTRHNLTSKLLYGRAFRAPAFAELFTINNPVILGNPELKPEVINTYEIAFDYRPSFDLKLGFNFYHYHIHDLVQYVPNPGGTSTSAQNVGKQKGNGYEMELNWKTTKRLTLQGHYAVQNASDTTLDSDVANTPQNQLYLSACWKLTSDWILGLQTKWIENRSRIQGDPRQEIKDYNTLDFLGRRSMAQGWSIALGVRNLLDKDRREPSPANLDLPAGSAIPDDFPLEGRKYYIEARYNTEKRY